jgi:hypothetical protein
LIHKPLSLGKAISNERKLSVAGWRYAIMIGITDPYDDDRDDLSEAVMTADRAKYPHFLHEENGYKVWDEKEATTFVQDLTGYDRRTCAAWLDYDWNDGGEKTDAGA